MYHQWYGNVKPNRLSNNNVKYFRIDAALREQKRGEWNQPVVWPVIAGLLALAASMIPAVLVYRHRERGTGISNVALKMETQG